MKFYSVGWLSILFLVLVLQVEKGQGSFIGELFGRMIGNNKDSGDHLQSNNNANDCAGCTVVIALLEQISQIHNSSITDVLSGICDIFPSVFKPPCASLVATYGPAVIKLVEEDETPDEVCQQIGFCANQTCNLFPKRARAVPIRPNVKFEFPAHSNVPAFQWPWELVSNHLPALDNDHDKYSTASTLRGTHWRGKDCNDLIDNIYPGRSYNNFGPKVDHNCNGISGIDSTTNKAWEDILCAGTNQLGYVVLGDSAAAHFHIPPAWVTASQINNETFSDLLEILEDELDWPEMSSASGYMNETWVGYPVGPVDSVYLRMRERNLCMHRDYQNIGVNGARSGAMNSSIDVTLARDQKFDNPLFLTYALIGNDVCNGHFGLSHMTTPQEFYVNVVAALNFLDTKLPSGSHVSFMGLVDGRILYDSMATRIHPIGSLDNDVTYSKFYDYLNCLEISPCFGWMNSDEYWRNATTERAMELNAVYQQIIKNHTFEHFDMAYFDCPMHEVVATWEKMGGEAWQIIEPVDGFHPNQIANALLTEVIWNNLVANFSDMLPPVNPNNQKILELFGQQGGY
jgi:acyloxyacyl hydrolase